MSDKIKLPSNSIIVCQEMHAGEGVQIGPDVQIECERLRLGDGVRIGCTGDSDFRAAAGVRIRVGKLELENGVIIGRCVHIRGGHIRLDQDVRVKDWNDIHVQRRLHIGARGTVNEHCEIGGIDIQFGRELWMLPYAKIGGGSAFEVQSSLQAGHFLHVGMYALINTARAVTVGDEVGLGTRTALYTHGAYPSELRGAPVAFGEIHIGDRSWLPGAIVNPGITIGRDCVIGVGSVVTRDIPEGALAAGAPCKVIRENVYPRELSTTERREKMGGFLRALADICTDHHAVQFDIERLEMTLDGDTAIAYRETLDPSDLAETWIQTMNRLVILAYGEFPRAARAGETFIDLKHRRINGQVCPVSERLLNQLRRYGTRFWYEPVDGVYQSWDTA
jgi:acetyltransferase-like isoleucine patch superfamily enzyme